MAIKIKLEEWLPTFFAEYQQVKRTDFSGLSEWLPVFFDEYRKVRVPSLQQKYAKPASPIDAEKLKELLHHFKDIMPDARKGAFHCDPWEVACLGSDEVRNSAVLAWLLNPRGSHGIGDIALKALLTALEPLKSLKDTGKFCHMRTESNPTGEVANRVDIEIDSENFYLIIEVKINAVEGDKQIERYGEIAKSRSYGRPWALLFLTLQGAKPTTAGKYIDNVCSMSWSMLANIITDKIKPVLKEEHASKTASRIMAEQMVLRYLSRMRSY